MKNPTSKVSMITSILLGITLLVSTITTHAAIDNRKGVILHTNLGDIQIELNRDEAPKTVDNFLSYVDQGFYDGTLFHRVIDGFMVQGGGFGPKMTKKKTLAPIPNEADNGLKNKKGTISMARTMDPHSASSQFFINVADNDFLDFSSKTARGWGYCVFAKVTKGQEVVDAITQVKTTTVSGFQNVPVTDVVISSVEIVE
jgi:peptidyl-prolyl cis-trans isomerase B (cyclophilin B)